MRRKIAVLSGALILLAAAWSSAPARAADDFGLKSTIAFTSTRDNLIQPNGAEIYLMDTVDGQPDVPDATDVRRLTYNMDGDALPSLSPDGKKIVFDSNRNRADGGSDPCIPSPTPRCFTSDLFLMNTDGTEQTLLTRGSSGTWSPDSKSIAFHASASGAGTPLRTQPGSATTDSDIFVANVDDLLVGVEMPTNITNSPGKIDDDADWSPDGESIVYTAHDVGDEGPNYDPNNPSPPFNSPSAEIYVRSPDGAGTPERLTNNGYEERGPSWSPDGTRIAFACRIGSVGNVVITDFEICVMNADGTNLQQLTDNSVQDLTPTFSPDGQQIVFHRSGFYGGTVQTQQLFTMQPQLNPDGGRPTATPLTSFPGFNYPPAGNNNLANWGVLRVHDGEQAP